MKYTINGKNITIPDKEIEKGMKILGLTKEESIQMYLEDNGHLVNQDQETLEQVARAIKIDHGASAIDKTKSKPRAPRTYVNTDEKILVYTTVKQALESLERVQVTELTHEKLLEVTFPSNDRPIKVDIIQKRPKKTT